MQEADRLQRLFDYDHWATREMLISLDEQEQFDSRDEALRLMGHLLSSQQIWHRRLSGKSYRELDFWPEMNVQDCISLMETLSKKWSALLDVQREHLDRKISYEDSNGNDYESALGDILHHLIIHGQHHRAQIATLMRQSGVQPPATDFIVFTRTRSD